MTEYFSEPGFWVLFLFVLSGAVHLVASVLARPKTEKFIAACEIAAKIETVNDYDRAWMKAAVEQSRMKSLAVVSIIAPIMPFIAIPYSLYVLITKKNPLKDRSVEKMRARNLALQTFLSSGKNATKGNLWHNQVRSDIMNMADELQNYQSPMAWLWTCFWALVTIAVIAPFFIISGQIKLLYNVIAKLRFGLSIAESRIDHYIRA